MAKRISKIVFILIISGVFSLAVSPSLARAITSQEILDQIAQLQAQIVALQQQLQQLPGTTAVWCHDFNTNLKYGDAGGTEVDALHVALEKQGFDINEDEFANNVFGEYTASAVVGFQVKYSSEILTPLGLKYGTGFVGKATREKLNKLYGCILPPTTRPLYQVEVFNEMGDWSKTLTRGTKYTFVGKISNGKPNSQILFYLQRPDGTMEYNGLFDWPPGCSVGEGCGGSRFSTDANGNFKQTITEVIPNNTQTGTWISWVTVAGSMSNRLYHSVVATAGPSITILSPNGGENWVIGKTYSIVWESSGLTPSDKILISAVSSTGWEGHIAYNIPGNLGLYYWAIPSNFAAGSYKIKLDACKPTGECYSDLSDNYFSIVSTATGSLYLSTSPDTPPAQKIIKGVSTTLLKAKFTASNVEDIRINGFDIYPFLASESRPVPVGDVVKFKLYDGAVQIGLPWYSPNSSGYVAVTNLNWVISKNASKILTVKAEASLNSTTTAFKLVINSEALSATGLSSNSAVQKSGSAVGSVMTIIGNEASITVLSPNGGEKWIKGTTQAIKWQDNTPISLCATGAGASCVSPAPKYYDIKLFTYYPPCTETICPMNVVAPSYTIAKSVSGSLYSWPVGKVLDTNNTAPDGSYTIQVCQINSTICDSSNSYFKIVSTGANNPPVISGIPAIPSDIKVGQSVSFSWSATDADGDNLSWSVSWGDGTGIAEVCVLPNPQNKQGWTFKASHAWANAGTYTVKATVNDCRGGSANHTFNVTVGSNVQPFVTVISPNGGETFIKGVSYTIKWSSSGFASGAWAQIQLRKAESPDQIVKVIVTSMPMSAGSYDWTIPSDVPDGKYLIWMTGPAPSLIDFSDAPFSIVSSPTPSITVLSPNGGEQWRVGNTYSIIWESSGLTPSDNILISAVSSAGQEFHIAYNIAGNLGLYYWAIPSNFTAGSYKIKVEGCKSAGACYSDLSDNYFSITAAIAKPSITVLSPNGGEEFNIGSPMTIKWQNINYRNSVVNIFLYRSNKIPGDLDYNYVAQIGNLGQPNDGMETWIIPSSIPPSDNYFIRVNLDVQDPQTGFDMVDDSNAPFSIVSSIACTDSDGGENYYTRAKATGLYASSVQTGWIFGEDPNKASSRRDETLNYSIYYDHCFDSATSNQLNEGYCNADGKLASSGYQCPFGCQDGVCKQAVKFPDLAAPAGLTVTPDRRLVNQEILITFKMINQGEATASPAVYMYTKQADGFSSIHQSNTCTNSTVLQPGEGCLAAYVFKFPTPGMKQIEVKLDPSNQLKEPNENNNVFGIGFEVVESPVFSNLSADLSSDKASFNFSFSETSSLYRIDMSILPDMSWGTYLDFTWGEKSPLTHDSPQARWDQYRCGQTLYWRVYSSGRGDQSPIQKAIVNCL
ncbi:MAG: Ser-Thr-rich GPI-anchored membrane family protein [bacterium]|nr:Ser-Thr-rich GPI-anchored membrane family protein [bacterium]